MAEARYPQLPLHLQEIEEIDPPFTLRDKVSYRPLAPGEDPPAERAEKWLSKLEPEFHDWLGEDTEELTRAWSELAAHPDDPEAFGRVHRLLHRIKGNAAILGNPAAGRLAAPLAALMERSQKIEEYGTIIGLGTDIIHLVVRDRLDIKDARIIEAIAGLCELVVHRTGLPTENSCC